MKIKVKIVREIAYKKDSGWGSFACDTDDKVEIKYNQYGNFAIAGHVPQFQKGEEVVVELGELVVKGQYESYPIIRVYLEKPVSSDAQYTFLEYRILTAIQFNAFCDKYPKNKKLKVLDMIKSGELDLTTVKGIGDSTADSIKKKIIANEDNIQIVNKLSPLGISQTMINRIMSHYNYSAHRVIMKINESVYNLCEVKGLGFKKVDEYALKNGEDMEGSKRIEACINYLVHEAAGEGHSWTSFEQMTDEAIKLLKIDRRLIEEFLLSIDNKSEGQLLNVNGNQITSKSYYQQEKSILKDLLRIDQNYNPIKDSKLLNAAIQDAEEILNITYTDEQRNVILDSFNHGVYVINGRAGSGKSTLIKGITEICNKLNLSYKSIALSGRAAQLLVNKGILASTIHRGLGFGKDGFMFNSENKLEEDVIILEEASMVNAYLWYSIAQAIRDGAKLIIVGDSGQLSAIGNGDVLRDLLMTKYFNGTELKQIHRQAQDSGIIEVANSIREGNNVTGYNWELSESHGVNSDLYLFTYNNKEVLLENAKDIIHKQMNKLDKRSVMDFQILVANKTSGNMSAVNINKLCQSIYNKSIGKPISNSTYDFKLGDKVINSGNKYDTNIFRTINDYHNDIPIMEEYKDAYGMIDEKPVEVALYNGTLGIIVDMNLEEQTILVEFEGIDGYVRLTKEQLSDLDLAYAITTHKSQGISVPNTLVLLDYGAFKLLSKQLVYTAMTRASKKCVLLAENNALHKSCQTDGSGERRTFTYQLINAIK